MIPGIIGGHIINNAERAMLSSLTHLESLGLNIFGETAENEYKDSARITSNLQAQILGTNNNEDKTKRWNQSWTWKKTLGKTKAVPGNIRRKNKKIDGNC